MGRTAWTLRAQTGCDEVCSYCIIPTTRGTSRSRALDDVLGELRGVVASGYKEVALTGVHLGRVGTRPARRRRPSSICWPRIAAEPGDFRVRVSSLEPMDCTPAVLDAVAGHPAALRRTCTCRCSTRPTTCSTRCGGPYTIERYAALVDERAPRGCRTRPSAPTSSSGFPARPTRTPRRSRPISRRRRSRTCTSFRIRTAPAPRPKRMPGKVHGAVVKARAQRLREISRALATRFRAAQTGRVRPALTIDDGRMAVTDNYLRVAVPPGRARNEWIDVVCRRRQATLAAG